MIDQTQPARILNINADAATREFMSSTLSAADYAVVEAAAGARGLALARERPDLIILDVRLPDISGLEVCRRLKADPLTAHIPVLQTSATQLSTERKVEGLDSGADAYLAQPIEDLELVAMVRAMLRTRRAEEAERLACLKWQRTFDAMSDGVLVLDWQGMVVNCNRAMGRILDVDPERAAGNALDRVLGLRVSRELKRAWPANPHGPRWETEVELRDHWYRLVADAATGPENRGFSVLVFSDIDERKKLEEGYRRTAYELAFAARRKEEFLAMLAHELRNPLNAIVAANGLQATLGPSEESVHLSSVVDRQTRHLARMIDDLLDVSRITRGEIQMRKDVVELSSIIGRVCDSQRVLLDARRQRIVLSLPELPVCVAGDELRLEQVVCNLLVNASQYSEAGSEIRLALSAQGPDGDRAVLTLTDAGIGIPPDMLEAVFEMFVQVDRSLARTSGGLGLGLTVVKQVVEQHGGTVRAQSAGIGKGATFVVNLPRCAEPDAKRESGPQRSATEPAGSPGGLDVLVVEDNDDSRELVAALLEARGHRVQCAADGLAGVSMAAEYKPDVALIDIGLPEMSGYEVAQRVRASAGGGAPFLVAVTGYGSPEDQARASHAGFDAHIVKPIDSQALFKLLARAAARRGGAGPVPAAGTA
jgi:signal transduction histidine kinase